MVAARSRRLIYIRDISVLSDWHLMSVVHFDDIYLLRLLDSKAQGPHRSMLASCCGARVRASYGDLKSGRGMDELSVMLRDGQPGTLRCDEKVIELLGSQ